MVSIKEVSLEYLMPNLGVPKFTYNQVKFNCPKCDKGNKYNLEISTDTLIFNCWSCHYSGYITKILREYAKNDSWKLISEFRDSYKQKISGKVTNSHLKLPDSIVPFYFKKEVEDYLVNIRKIDKEVLKDRKVSYVYSEEEPLYNHIIFPYYDITGTILTGYSVQNFETKKYKNFGKQIFVPYIQFINPNYPICLTEGGYDSLSLPNAIPLLGTGVPKAVLEFLTNKNVILALDNTVEEQYKQQIVDALKHYSVNFIHIFNTGEYKDLNEFRQKDRESLIKKYKLVVETIMENSEKFTSYAA